MPTVFESYPQARRPIHCMSCEYLIKRGERYHRWTGRNDLWIGLATHKECAACCIRWGHSIPGGGEDVGGAAA